MRVDRSLGESIDEHDGREWIQAPHVIVKDGVHHMFYGGHMTEAGDGQICLATSPDGRDFTRHRNANGYSRVFQGPAESRDPMVLKIGELYYCYYTGHDVGRPAPCKIYCRTSPDLIEWSDFREVSWGGSGGSGNWDAECPFVVHLDGYYYLFRTSWYWPPAVTHVYRSRRPPGLRVGRRLEVPGNDTGLCSRGDAGRRPVLHQHRRGPAGRRPGSEAQVGDVSHMEGTVPPNVRSAISISRSSTSSASPLLTLRSASKRRRCISAKRSNVNRLSCSMVLRRG